jgi:hypothetical protein
LKNEFKKANITREDLKWKLSQIIIVVFSTLIPLPWVCEMLFKTRLELTSGQQVSILAATTTLSLLAWSGRLAYGIFPAILDERVRRVICLSSGLLVVVWGIFFHIILPHYDFSRNQLCVMNAWGLLISGGIVIGSTSQD